MKIRKINTYVLKVPLGKKRFYSSQCPFPERNSFLVRIETDEGIYGWGEGGQYGPAEPLCSCVEHVLAPLLIGRDPFDKGVLWSQMYAMTRDFGQKGSYIEAISAIDIALWDICGKASKLPVSTLLGGRFRDKVKTYATGCYYRGDDYLDVNEKLKELQSEAKSYIDSGFNMLKIKVGLLSIEQDYLRVKAIREAVGEDVRIFVDANHAYNSFSAIKMGRYLEELGIDFFEEPVPPEDKEGYIEVRKTLDMAVAGGECEYTRYGFKELIARGCIDIAQPDICVCGGLTEFMNIVALATSYGVLVVPHVWGSGIALSVALSAISSLPCVPHTANPVALQNEPAIEYDRNFNPLRDELLIQQFSCQDNCVYVPEGPGLGIDINDDVLYKYAVYSGEAK